MYTYVNKYIYTYMLVNHIYIYIYINVITHSQYDRSLVRGELLLA